MFEKEPSSIIQQIPFDCRYLCVLPVVRGSFVRLLEDLGVKLPGRLELHDLITLGLLRPALSVQLPDEFFLQWPDFPDLSRPGQWREELHWAVALWHWCVMPRFDWRVPAAEDSWFVHPLDRTGETVAQLITQHSVNTDVRLSIAPVRLRRGQAVSPVVDLFRYWQAYELQDVTDALPLFGAIPNVPDAGDRLRGALGRLDEYKHLSDARLARVTEVWLERRSVFDWVSRVRTAVGVVRGGGGDDRSLDATLRQLAADLALGPDRIRSDIRDVLLVLWSEWEFLDRRRAFPQALWEHLREDIELAVFMLQVVADEEVDPSDSFWDPPDPNPRRWARLKDVLPYEEWHAQEEFPIYAALYLANANRVLPDRGLTDRGSLTERVRRHWRQSAGFRRFCLAFLRLHEHYGGRVNARHLVPLTATTPMAFLELCALETEKTLTEAARSLNPEMRASPGLKDLLIGTFDQIASRLSLAAREGIKARLREEFNHETSLHDLPRTRRNPFLSLDDTGRRDAGEFLRRAILNVAVMRNYAAHHDCLDHELINSGMAMAPIESMLVTMLLMLDSVPPLH